MVSKHHILKPEEEFLLENEVEDGCIEVGCSWQFTEEAEPIFINMSVGMYDCMGQVFETSCSRTMEVAEGAVKLSGGRMEYGEPLDQEYIRL
jgi:hypothetical protein